MMLHVLLAAKALLVVVILTGLPIRVSLEEKLVKIPPLVLEINAYRAKAGLPPYEFSPELQKAAQRHADDMSKHNFLGHVGTDGSSFSQRARDAGFRGSSGGEIAAPEGDPQTAVRMWRGSPGHNAQMLSRHQYIGAATSGKNAAVAVFFSK